MAYNSPWQWPSKGRVSRPEFLAHNIRRARVDCTDHNGRMLESIYISAPSLVEIQPIRNALYNRFNRMHGHKGIYIFYNDLSLKESSSPQEEAA